MLEPGVDTFNLLLRALDEARQTFERAVVALERSDASADDLARRALTFEMPELKEVQ
jgi:hypothetical protein